MTDADDTVEERDMLSVDALIRVLNNDAARDFFFGVGVGSSPGPSVGLGLLLYITPLDLALTFVFDKLALIDVTSPASSSRKAGDTLKARARRRRPFNPPLRSMAGVGAGSNWLSSLDMRFSEAVKVP